jgi:hypothetical protein
MEEETIPADIGQFILQNLDSIAQLEGLLLLRANPSVSWNARMISSRLYISENEAAGVLAELTTRGFLKKDFEPISFTYIPVSKETAKMTDRLAQLYACCLVPVTKLIHSKSSSKIQQFADAFRMRKDKQ